MISILIPVYGENVNPSVKGLITEIENSNIKAELIILEDAHPQPVPVVEELRKTYVHYEILSENLGRSKIRNELAKRAKYDLLLYLDADCIPIRKDYIHAYLERALRNTVMVGGQSFGSSAPEDPKKILRWKYGHLREEATREERASNPMRSFVANNFCVAKNILDNHPFTEDHQGYGHEDTLFGAQLRKNKVTVTHIDNPILHMGLDDTDLYIAKSIEAVQNLAGYYLDGRLGKEILLIRAHLWLKTLGLLGFFDRRMEIRMDAILRDLHSSNPSLFNFDLLKLYHFNRAIRRIK